MLWVLWFGVVWVLLGIGGYDCDGWWCYCLLVIVVFGCRLVVLLIGLGFVDLVLFDW